MVWHGNYYLAGQTVARDSCHEKSGVERAMDGWMGGIHGDIGSERAYEQKLLNTKVFFPRLVRPFLFL